MSTAHTPRILAIHTAHHTPNDNIWTPLPIAKLMIEMCGIQENEKVLDPSYGAGAFYNQFPKCVADYNEINEDRDFFKNENVYDVIIGNPPYSKWTKWIEHTLKICKNRFCYIFGAQSLTPNRIKMIHEAGFGITKMHLVKVAWYMSQSYIILCEKGKSSIITVTPGTFPCEFCNTMCGRGIHGNPPNECNYEKKMEARKQKLKKPL